MSNCFIICSFINSLLHAFSHWFLPSFINSFRHSLIQSFNPSFIPSFFDSSLLASMSFHVFHLSSVASFISFLTSSQRIPIYTGLPLPIIMAYFGNLRPCACRALSAIGYSYTIPLLLKSCRSLQGVKFFCPAGSAGDLHPGTILYDSCQLWAVCAKVIAAIDAQLWIEAVFIASLGELKVPYSNGWQNMTKRHKNT